MPTSPEPRVTLEDLIKLKRHEEPDAAFWSRFERDFEHRRLRALIEDDGSATAPAGAGWLRQVGWTFGALAAAVAFAALGLSRHGPNNGLIAGEGTDEAETAMISAAQAAEGPAFAASFEANGIRSSALDAVSEFARSRRAVEPRFVIDAIPSQAEPSHFQRILANPAFIQAGQSGAEFVADTLTTSGRSGAAFVVDRPRGQF